VRQYDFGSRQYGQTMLNLVENVSGDDENALQSNIAVSNDCSMPSIYFNYHSKHMLVISNWSSASTDECIIASEVYECNNKNNPSFTQAGIMQVNSTASNTQIVYIHII
jgi:hypothetical protein